MCCSGPCARRCPRIGVLVKCIAAACGAGNSMGVVCGYAISLNRMVMAARNRSCVASGRTVHAAYSACRSARS